MPNRTPHAAPLPDHRESPPQGRTVPIQGERQERAPRAPHERDESADSQAAGEPSGRRMADLGRKDLESGQADTDKGPVMGETYERVREGTPDPRKKFSP